MTGWLPTMGGACTASCRPSTTCPRPERAHGGNFGKTVIRVAP